MLLNSLSLPTTSVDLRVFAVATAKASSSESECFLFILDLQGFFNSVFLFLFCGGNLVTFKYF